jgi:DNA polymerase (family 10)
MHEEIATIFQKIASLLPKKEQYRSRAYRRAAESVLALGSKVATLSAKELQEVPGLGEGTVKKILEYRTSGKISRYLELELCQTEGKQAVTKIPRDVADKVVSPLIQELRQAFPEARIEVCGSYRRCKATVKDIDILVATSGATEAICSWFAQHLDGATPSHGDILTSSSGATQVRGYHSGLYFDLQVVPLSSWATALVFWTGSGDLNIKMRGIAKKKGMKLNRFNLSYRDTGEIIPTQTEQEVFQALGLKYLEPKDREFTEKLMELVSS